METTSPPPARGRGRPPSITHARIADAGIALGLRNITFVGVASALGVSHMALYKHVASLEALKQLVADEIIRRWQIPQALGNDPEELHAYLTLFSASIQAFVKAHPGVTPYMLRRMAASDAVIEKIQSHQRHIAQAYGIAQERAQRLLATVAFNCFAAADTVYSAAAQEPVIDADRAAEEAEMEVEFTHGMQALIWGALRLSDGDAERKPRAKRAK